MAKKTKKKGLKKIARAHVFFSISLFVLYLALSTIYSPEFLLSDIRGKFKALADDTIAITATVLGPPAKPVVSGAAVCDNGNLSISLNWADDENSQTFSIERDSLLLVSGLTSSQYSDTSVAIATSYTYTVTAHGEMDPGIAISDPVIIATPDECAENLPTPEVEVTDFEHNGLRVGDKGIPQTESHRPFFAGTTNISNANINLLINDDIIISANIIANANGYWSWQPSINLSHGRHILYATATDPLDPARTASANFTFFIEEKEEDEEENESKTKTSVIPPAQAEIPLAYNLTLKNDSVLPGKNLEAVVNISKLLPMHEGKAASIKYIIVDSNGNEKEGLSQKIVLHLGAKIENDIPIAKYFQDGKYKLRTEIILGRYNISREINFTVLPLPILKFGGGTEVTYPELLSRLGTISLWLLIALIIWLIIFSREYWLQLHALRHITERNLIKLGLIGMKKRRGGLR